MHFLITHTTRYRYAQPVCLEPHVLRVRPRCDGAQRLIDFRVRVQPRPVGWSECVDLDGNAVTQIWFDGLMESMTVASRCTVETLRSNPFDFLIEPWAGRLPMRPPGELEVALAPYRNRSDSHVTVAQLAEGVLRETGGQTIAFLSSLCRRIRERCQPVTRLEGEPQPPERTLQEGTGACRDLAVVFIDACRAVGLAARFVSGYHRGESDAGQRYLHAWAEVFLPGAGWRGFDPVEGFAVSDRHVAVAASAVARDAAPISGTFRGSDAAAIPQVELEIEVSDQTLQQHRP